VVGTKMLLPRISNNIMYSKEKQANYPLLQVVSVAKNYFHIFVGSVSPVCRQAGKRTLLWLFKEQMAVQRTDGCSENRWLFACLPLPVRQAGTGRGNSLYIF